MKSKKRPQQRLSERETRVLERLREHPELMERMESILELVDNEGGPLKTADEMEELLIQEMRRLGNETMTQWAVRAEDRVGRELKEKDPSVKSRKKNAEVVVRVWVGGSTGTHLAQRQLQLCASTA